MPSTVIIRAYASADDAEIVWRYPKKIADCWGFAILRQKKGESEALSDWVKSSVGFEGDPHSSFEFHDTTFWPIQRYNWTDYLVSNGDTVRYKVIPMIHKEGKLVKDGSLASPWSNWVDVATDGTDGFFNRGQVSAQFVSRSLKNLPEKEKKKTLLQLLEDENSLLRQMMGGALLEAIYSILDEPVGKSSIHLFCALYELNDKVLIKKLNALGKRAHIILANGAFDKNDPDPEQENAEKLKKVDLTRRVVKTPHFAHNKFAVLAKKQGEKYVPYKVLTGTTNWTRNGLFTQANTGLILDDPEVCQYYLDEWTKMKDDCIDGKGSYAKPFKDFNASVHSNTKGDTRTWFTPTKDLEDMNEALDCIAKAKKGILFLMFKPGTIKSAVLYKAIHERAKEQNSPFIAGVINTDPGGKANPTIHFLNKGKQEKGDMSLLTPSNIKAEFEFWSKELAPQAVTIHSKTIVIDPFGKNPVVICGSHNMGIKASKSNDDNLNIIRGNSALAQTLAVNMLAIYHHYRWRFYRSKVTDKNGNQIDARPKWKGLKKSDEWQRWFDKGRNRKELNFWLGK